MCRSIKTLRAPYAHGVTDQDVRAAALQYVQTLSGYRVPPAADAAAFEDAVEQIHAITGQLLDRLQAPALPAAGA